MGGASTTTTRLISLPSEQVKEFHQAFGLLPYIEQPDTFARQKMVDLRMKLIREEFREVMDELLDLKNGEGNFANLAKELSDLLYVVYGAAVDFDIPIDLVFAEVHRSNMSKLGPDGKPVRRSDGKVMKGPNYTAPDIESVLGVSD